MSRIDLGRVRFAVGSATLIGLVLAHAILTPQERRLAPPLHLPPETERHSRPEAVMLPPPPLVTGDVRSETDPALGTSAEPLATENGNADPSPSVAEAIAEVADRRTPVRQEPPVPAPQGLIARPERAATLPTQPASGLRSESSNPIASRRPISPATRLRLAEHGQSPTIVLVWPGRRTERDRLDRVMRRCFGMRDARLTAAGRVVSATELQRSVDFRRYSRLLRLPNGVDAAGDGPRRSTRLHIFPRRFDVVFLDTLATAGGVAAAEAKTISGRYRLAARAVEIVDLRIDGRLLPDVVLTPIVPACRW